MALTEEGEVGCVVRTNTKVKQIVSRGDSSTDDISLPQIPWYV